MSGLKEELESVQSQRSLLQREADSRVLAKSGSSRPPPAQQQQQQQQQLSNTNSEHMEGIRPPNELRSSGEVSYTIMLTHHRLFTFCIRFREWNNQNWIQWVVCLTLQ